jgi:hypothetical protein
LHDGQACFVPCHSNEQLAGGLFRPKYPDLLSAELFSPLHGVRMVAVPHVGVCCFVCIFAGTGLSPIGYSSVQGLKHWLGTEIWCAVVSGGADQLPAGFVGCRIAKELSRVG